MEGQTTQWPKEKGQRQAMIYKKYKITISKKLLLST